MTHPLRTRHTAVSALCMAGAGVVGLSACGAVEAQQGTQAIVKASSVSCSVARSELQRAVEAYTMLEQKPPANEQALIPGYLLAPSQLMDIDANGKVVAAPGSGCP
jgi:hypothetical protein